MTKYESVIIISPLVGEDKMKEIVSNFSEMINKDGKVENVEVSELKKLAYQIKKFDEAFYVVFNYTANSNVVNELERNFRISEDVIKYITINCEEK